MAIYEIRTYSIKVECVTEFNKLYTEKVWPALEAGGFAKNCVGYFMSDTGTLHQMIHIWRFEDDAERREFTQRSIAYKPFYDLADDIRALVDKMEAQLLNPAPWGPAN